MPPKHQTRYRADTLIKSFTPLTAKHQMTRASDVAKAVDEDLHYNMHVANTEEFLAKILPIPDAHVDAIYDRLQQQGHYDAVERHWVTSPPNPDPKQQKGPSVASSKARKTPLEKEFYGPFVEVATAIRNVCTALVKSKVITRGDDCVDGAWVNRADTALETRDADAASIRPDIVNASLSDNYEKLEQLIRDLTPKSNKVCISQIFVVVSSLICPSQSPEISPGTNDSHDKVRCMHRHMSQYLNH